MVYRSPISKRFFPEYLSVLQFMVGLHQHPIQVQPSLCFFPRTIENRIYLISHMNAIPAVSIIMPVYNREKLLIESIDSVLAQTHTAWELIVVDDGSTDSTCEVVLEASKRDMRIRLLRREGSHRGAPVCRNLGIRYANAEKIIFFDSDDIMAPWCIESRLLASQEWPNIDMLIFEALEFCNCPQETLRLRTFQGTANPLKSFLSFQSCWQTSCVLWNKSSLQNINGWHESTEIWQDGEIHVRALNEGLTFEWMHKLPDVFIRVHKDASRISGSGVSGKRLINMTETYLRLFHQLKETSLKVHFLRVYSESIVNICEVMSQEDFETYKQWFQIEKPTFWRGRRFLWYIALIRSTRPFPILFKCCYQFRKLGIPFFRHHFFMDSPLISREDLLALAEKNKAMEEPCTHVNLLKHSKSSRKI